MVRNIEAIWIVLCQLLVASCIQEDPTEPCEEEEVVDVNVADLLPDSLASFEGLKMYTASLVFYPASGGAPINGKIAGNTGKVSIPHGRYSFLIYTSDFYELDANFYRGMEHPETAEAYARQSSDGRTSVVEEPDPLFCLFLENIDPDEQTTPISLKLIPRVYTYRFRIKVEGIEHLQSATARVTGMYTSVYLKDGRHHEEEAADVLVHMKKEMTDSGQGYIYGAFRSFGSHQRSDVKHHISITLNNGETKVVELDDLTIPIKAMPRGGEIVIKQKIVIEDNGGNGQTGGFNPDVIDWDENEVPLPI